MDNTATSSPETKAGAAPSAMPTSLEVVEAFDEFMQAFEAFKETNDQRLAEIEARVSSDVVTTEKMDRINRALDEIALKGRRAPLAGESPAAGPSEHKQAFEAYVRRGDETRLRGFEAKSINTATGSEGGYLVAPETETEIARRLAQVSPIRAIAAVRQISAGTYKKPFAISGPATGWVGETDARPETAAPTLAELEYPAMELYAMPAATQTLLDDTAVDIDAWIAQEVETVFAEQEGAAFVNGDGNKKPTGFLNATQVADASWSWGNLGYLVTGVSGDFAASDPADILVDIVFALRAGYRQNAHFVMNRKTQAEVRKIKDADGNYLWQPGHQPGTPPTLLGFPVTEAEDMPDIAADATPIAFGDFSRGYLIVDRIGTRILRDPYSSKPYVLFYTTRRVGGGVHDFEAIKLLKFGTA